MPDSATAVVGIDVDALSMTAVGHAIRPSLRADLQLADGLELLEDCGLPIERTYALTLGRDAGDGRVAIIQAPKVGTAPILECLASELRARSDGEEAWRRSPAGSSSRCHATLDLADGSRAWIVDANTLVWARGSFVDPTGARLDGRASATLPSNLRAEFGRLDRSGHLWLAAKLDDDDRSALPGSWSSELASLTAAIDLSAGLRAVVSFAPREGGTLASMRERVWSDVADLGERLEHYGVEHRLHEHSSIGVVGGVVALELVLDERELNSIRKHVGPLIRGRGPL